MHRTDSVVPEPEDVNPSRCLLGDSMIHGHGLEEHSTVRYHLRSLETGGESRRAGNSIHQEYQVLKSFGLRLKPAYVFLFFQPTTSPTSPSS
jgi:hypothetical protein